MTAAIAIFVKTPGLSPLKTRLAAGMGNAAASRFHVLAAAAVAAAARGADDVVQGYWAVAEEAGCDAGIWRGFPALWQGEGGLGQRLDRIYASLMKRHDRVLLVGADMPALTPALIRQAVARLDDPDCPYTLGPAEDGGFWLFGGRAPVPAETWAAVPYSTSGTADALRYALRNRGGLSLLPTRRDIDTADDLPPLRDALRGLAEPSPEQQRLAAWLEEVRLPG
ncbi:TIGR04282 family arsenosugar biosynthesis glycosyltransferase [Teichococcus vastitatis]|uniref:DUF2064 domain-containing protein n=1 Tax=Teichococcus vastitatis TaxID=2307076 RepID=A0ABS9W778_9PROT|nr:DUF2064 domain-containing protein [Pseudoroseomonas vastitatis]MCI0755087.1 DUF2064 domain-containing protein [Pseudoroseomonas vastitatis]